MMSLDFKLIVWDDTRVLHEERVRLAEGAPRVARLRTKGKLVVETVDEARRLALTRLQLVGVEGVVLG